MIAARQIFLGRGGAKLPYDAEVEYLESTGTQFIDTGLNADSSLGYDITSSITDYNQSYDQPFGVLHRNPIIRHHFGNITSENPSVLAILLGDGSNFIVRKSEGTSGEIVRWMVDTVNRTASIDNVSGSWGSVSAFDTGLTFYLFGRHDSSSDRLISARCYSARFYVNGVLVRDFIPVRFTNELGQSEGAMYDRVSGQLFRNQGTGAFLYGADKIPIETDRYVQDGLIAMWDGKENAGVGLHDANATVWKDLTTNGYDMELKNGAAFDTNSLVTADRNKVTALLNIKLPYASIEVCGFIDSSRNSSALVCFGNSVDDNRMFSCYQASVQTYNGAYQILFSTQPPARSTWAGTHDGSNHLAYINGNAAVGTVSTNNWSSRTGTFGLSGSSNYHIYNFVGNYYCVRLYDRALTAAEIAANYAVDKQRFNLP